MPVKGILQKFIINHAASQSRYRAHTAPTKIASCTPLLVATASMPGASSQDPAASIQAAGVAAVLRLPVHMKSHRRPLRLGMASLHEASRFETKRALATSMDACTLFPPAGFLENMITHLRSQASQRTDQTKQATEQPKQSDPDQHRQPNEPT